MSEVIDFKTRKVIKAKDPLPKKEKEVKKQKTISLLKDLIKELESNKLDPEECIVMLKWSVSKNQSSYQVWKNDIHLTPLLGLIEVIKNKIITEW